MFYLNRNILHRNIQNKNKNTISTSRPIPTTPILTHAEGNAIVEVKLTKVLREEEEAYENKINIEKTKKILYFQPYIITKKTYEPVIPLVVYQTWYTKDFPPSMQKNVDNLKKQNPEFTYHLYDDNDCREFIRTNFSHDVLNAYDTLIPGAYKADLWRYCVLYKNGGMYIDIKLCSVNGFKLIELCEKEHYVLDRELPKAFNTPLPIYNAFMVCRKNSPFLLMAINKVVENVKKKYYGFSSLYPTGPGMLSKLFLETKQKGIDPNLNIDIYHYYDSTGLVYRDRFIMSLEYPEYRKEQEELNTKINKKNYTNYWLERNIYAK
jgi:mannosyltransferase OCH1-like enzyme